MTPEEYQRYKEAEKAHLRKLKELKKAVRTLERQKSVGAAAEKVAEGQDLLEKQKSLVDDLAMETARHEARLDIALDSAAEADAAANTEALEEELQRERAQALVRQLKRQMGADDDNLDTDQPVEARDSRSRGESGSSEAGSRKEIAHDSSSRSEGARGKAPKTGPDIERRADAERPTGGRDDRPEKTIGRM